MLSMQAILIMPFLWWGILSASRSSYIVPEHVPCAFFSDTIHCSFSSNTLSSGYVWILSCGISMPSQWKWRHISFHKVLGTEISNFSIQERMELPFLWQVTWVFPIFLIQGCSCFRVLGLHNVSRQTSTSFSLLQCWSSLKFQTSGPTTFPILPHVMVILIYFSFHS